MLRAAHGVWYDGKLLREENAARAAARRSAKRAAASSSSSSSSSEPVRNGGRRAKTTTTTNVEEDPVAAARRRIKEYNNATKRKEKGVEARRPSVWYSVDAAKRLVRDRKRVAARRTAAASRLREEHEALVAERLAIVSETVAAMLRGRFGRFSRGSFVLVAEPPSCPVEYRWRPPAFGWRPGPYSNRLVASHQGRGLTNIRLFGEMPMPTRAFKFAVRALRRRTGPPKFLLRTGNPRWQLAATALRRQILSDPAFIEKRKRDFRLEVDRTRRILRDRAECGRRRRRRRLEEEEEEGAPPPHPNVPSI